MSAGVHDSVRDAAKKVGGEDNRGGVVQRRHRRRRSRHRHHDYADAFGTYWGPVPLLQRDAYHHPSPRRIARRLFRRAAIVLALAGIVVSFCYVGYELWQEVQANRDQYENEHRIERYRNGAPDEFQDTKKSGSQLHNWPRGPTPIKIRPLLVHF